MLRSAVAGLIAVALFLAAAGRSAPAARAAALSLRVQRRDGDGRAVVERVSLNAKKTAIVVVDMWDRHWCTTYTARVGNLVPRMNRTLAAARRLGIQVVFAPSDVLAPYKDAPQRKAMRAIPPRALPKKVGFNPPGPPGGRDCCECGPDRPCKSRAVWTRQHGDLKIAPGDLIADCNNGGELLRLCGHRGIDTLVYMGVASNMCVLYRGCGLRNMKSYGLTAYFVSDLVQAITANGCDPASKKPDANFTPAEGTARVQRYLERHVAPSLRSRQILAAAEPGGDKRPHVAFVIAEQEYGSRDTLPAFAREHLGKDFRCTFAHASPRDRNHVTGLEALYDADLLVLSMRRRMLTVGQMDHLEHYIRSGFPVVALRVSVVPFQVRPRKRPGGRVIWERFDREVLGCNYRSYDARSRKTGCDVWPVDAAKGHPILRGLEARGFHSPAWLYRQKPLAKTCTLLMAGRWAKDQPAEPVAWTNVYRGGRVFYTTLGHPGDFRIPAFNRMLVNAIRWALGAEAPPATKPAD